VAAVGCVVLVFVAAAIVASAADDSPDSAPRGAGSSSASGGVASGADSTPGGSAAAAHGTNSVPEGSRPVAWVSTSVRVRRHEALPCTGSKEPINFEIFSAGPSVAGVPLTDFKRRCDGTTPVDEPPANFTNYFYGHCKIEGSADGCAPPLQIQSFPACQRSLADYSLEGRPLPYRELPEIGGAEVVEIDLMGEKRIEVYTGATTIVIFAATRGLAEEALAHLTPQQEGTPPAASAAELKADPYRSLAPPRDGAIEGELSCRS
jgi:hypothetical protein